MSFDQLATVLDCSWPLGENWDTALLFLIVTIQLKTLVKFDKILSCGCTNFAQILYFMIFLLVGKCLRNCKFLF